MKKKVIILGSTGSIGTQTLDVIRQYKDQFEVVGLACNSNVLLLSRQIKEFNPKFVAVADEKAAEKINPSGFTLFKGDMAIISMCTIKCDILVNALVGIEGLSPTITALKFGTNIALANKETLVTGGELVMKLAKDNNLSILPVDSEHSAIWQCLDFNVDKKINKIILTASGGAFRGKTKEEIANLKAKDALLHPTWNMGDKVTIDSATLMNKGLEVIEAMHLFNVKPENIDIVIHKESVIHSMIQYDDGSIIAQMSYPDMKLPIQVALNYPNRGDHLFSPLSFNNLQLNFASCDYDTFPCLKIALDVAKQGGLYPTIMNAANEELVKLYLQDKIKFYDISYHISKALEKFETSDKLSLFNIQRIDYDVREYIKKTI
ncbi:MAG: 1-deoxy-D-xylulose-5-phosphate reductoisomerase [Christensenella sp.]|nr:1-deoxy-D-xylulose-5-phosphate reductoisomerase [Christensenella sp.]